MTSYHIIIQQERRTDVARQALNINDQLHSYTAASLADVDFSDDQFVMVVEWDLVSPYVICHKGDYSARTMEYAGWPSGEAPKEKGDAPLGTPPEIDTM